MELIFASWLALKMVLGTLPGMSLVAYSFECGFEEKSVRIPGFLSFWKAIKNAKKEAIWGTARTFFPWFPALGVLAICIILLVIVADSVMLMAVNVTAVPVSVFSYKQGIKYLRGWGPAAGNTRLGLRPHEIALTVVAIRILGVWLALTMVLLTIAYGFHLWVP